MKPTRTYHILFSSLLANGIVLTENCNAISFTNKGADIVYINDYPLAQNETIAFNGLEGEIDKSTYTIAWRSTATDKQLFIQRKMYN